MAKREFHRYELVERIAVGGMAEVFRAKTFGLHGFEKELAVKRILPELVSSREFVDRFIAEAKIAVTLNHANIVQVTDFSRFADSLYIAMEFVDGIDLRGLLNSLRDAGRRMPVPVALHICIEVLKGLDFAHSRGVVHRDISPANILLSKSGEVKIADFGIAQAAEGGTGHTKPFRIMGKWRYMSPEQSLGEKLDSRSDLFSFATVMFELFTGSRLFDQEAVDEIVRAIRFHPLPTAASRRPDLPAGIDDILVRALHRNVDERGDAAGLGRALIELSYAKTIPVTASDLASLVREFSSPTASEPNTGSTSGGLIDNIINSELEQRRPGVNTRLTRLTPPGRASHPELLADEGMDASATNLTFVDGGLDADGITQWLLGNAEGGPLQMPDELTAALPTVAPRDETRGGDVVAMPPDTIDSTYHEPSADPHAPPGYQELYGYQPSDYEREPPRSRSVLVAAAVLGMVVALALVLLIGNTEPRKPTGVVMAAPADASEPRARADAGAMPLADAAPSEDARGPREPVVEAESMDFSTTLIVNSDPAGAEIRLAGQVLGNTPLELALPANDARQRLQLFLDGHHTESQMLRLPAGAVTRIDERLRPRAKTGEIDIFVKPWAQVYIGERKIGEAPARALSLPHGTHRLRLVNPVTGAEKTVTVTVPSDRAYRFSLD